MQKKIMLVSKIIKYFQLKKIASYAKNNSILFRSAPYKVELYKKILNQITIEESFRIQNFDGSCSQRKANFIFRHDLDKQQCLENFHILADIHVQLNVPLSVFVRTDNLDYPFKNSFRFLKPYLNKFQIGLHSSCYIYENPLKRLEEEASLFNEVYGFYPQFLTLHGLGQYKYAERLNLIKDLSSKYKDFGFVFTDCIPDLRTYDYVIQDCHLDNNGHRYIKKDFVNLPPRINGSCYLILAHPCYWEK